MSKLLKKFPNDFDPPVVKNSKGIYIILKNNKKYLDATSGWTSYATLGLSNSQIIKSITNQMKKFAHIDYNVWKNEKLEILADRLLKYAKNGIDRVYFGGTSGSDAIDAAMKLSYQIHHDSGNKKKISYISRHQSFNGATLHAMSVSELPILKIYEPLFPKNVYRISQHNAFKNCLYDTKKNNCVCGKSFRSCMGKMKHENSKTYTDRCVRELEDKILEVGPDNVAAFVGETQLGSLVGDVPPSKTYWKKISKICKKYNIHLILDEVYCGMGRSGKMFNYLWDDFSPDFVCMGKNMTSGHAPLSAILTKSKFEKIIAKGSGRIQLGHTFQGFSSGIAACYELINIIEKKKLLKRITDKGQYMMNTLSQELCKDKYFKNVRGRGFGFSVEHDTENNHYFALGLQERLKEKYKIIINSKWHRTSFVPSYLINDKEIDILLNAFIDSFKYLSKNISSRKNISFKKISKSMGGIKIGK